MPNNVRHKQSRVSHPNKSQRRVEPFILGLSVRCGEIEVNAFKGSSIG